MQTENQDRLRTSLDAFVAKTQGKLDAITDAIEALRDSDGDTNFEWQGTHSAFHNYEQQLTNAAMPSVSDPSERCFASANAAPMESVTERQLDSITQSKIEPLVVAEDDANASISAEERIAAIKARLAKQLNNV